MAKYNIEWTTHDFMDGLRKGFDGQYSLYYLEIKRRRFSPPEVLYIGKTSRQTVSDRLLGGHEKLKALLTDYESKDIRVGLGRVRKRDLSDKELENIEKALISHHKPRLNGTGSGRYKGPKISIINEESEDTDYNVNLYEDVVFQGHS